MKGQHVDVPSDNFSLNRPQELGRIWPKYPKTAGFRFGLIAFHKYFLDQSGKRLYIEQR